MPLLCYKGEYYKETLAPKIPSVFLYQTLQFLTELEKSISQKIKV
jgi:hypothetical protein